MKQTQTETKVVRKGRESYSSAILTAKRNKRRLEAEVRQALYDDLTTAQKIAKVKARGGSVKELTRLQALFKKEKEEAKKAKTEAPKPTVAVPAATTPATPEKGSKYKRKQAKKA